MLSKVLEKKQLTLVFGDNAAVVRNAISRDFKDILYPSFIYETPYNSNTITLVPIFDVALKGKEYSIYDDEVAGMKYFGFKSINSPDDFSVCDIHTDYLDCDIHNFNHLIEYLVKLPIDKILKLDFPEYTMSNQLQLKLGDLFIKALEADRQVVVHTTSDHLLNRVMRRVLEKPELMDKVAINYVHADGRITVGEIDKVKGLLLVPYCLFEYAEETSAIIDVGFHNLKNLKGSTNNG